jgi:hypothetical protein
MLNFTGVNYCVSVATMTPPTSGTVSFWIIPTALAKNLVLFDINGVLANSWAMRWGGTTTLTYRLLGNAFSTSTLTYAAGIRYHITGTWNITGGKSIQNLYRNGVSAGTATNTAGTPTASNLYLAARTGPASISSGRIEDFRMYNRVLSVEEIQTIYGSAGVDGIRNGLIHKYLMNEKYENIIATGTGTVLDDQGVTTPINLTPSVNPIYVGTSLKTKRANQL